MNMVQLENLFPLAKVASHKTVRFCIPVERRSLRVGTDKGRLITNTAQMRIVKVKQTSDNMPLGGEHVFKTEHSRGCHNCKTDPVNDPEYPGVLERIETIGVFKV